jgi:8-oxo-dGTP diphosphatase
MYCGGRLQHQIVEGHPRKICPDCGKITYQNPIPAVAMLALKDGDHILLVRRTVEPAIGHWCLPGGFIEMGETPIKALHRELMEETQLRCIIDRLFDVGTVINGYYGDVVVLAYLITIVGGEPQPGDDADQVTYFPVSELPPLAFQCHLEFIQRLCDITIDQHPEH